MSNIARIYWGISGFFGAKFFFVGVYMPFFPLVLAGRGLSAGQIAAIMALPPIARILATPVLGTWADRFADRRTAALLYAGLGFVMLVPVLWIRSFAGLLLITALASIFLAAVVPVADALAVVAAARHRLQYGRMRLWGSICFIAANLVAGEVLDLAGAERLVLVVLAAALATAAAALILPPDDAGDGERRRSVPLLSIPALEAIAAQKAAGLVLAAAALVQGSHAMVYAFGTIYWDRAGLSGTVIGLAWGGGVAAEIALFAWAGRLTGPRIAETLILLGAAAGVIRWLAMPFAAGTTAILGLQLLHGVTFGATHLGAMRVIAERLPQDHAGGVLGVYTAATGLVMSMAFALSGPAFSGFGGYGFWAMAALCLLATALVWRAAAAGGEGGC